VNPVFRVVARANESFLTDVDRRSPGPYPLTIVGWHRVDAAPGGLSTTPEELRRHLDLLEDWRVLPLDEAVRRLHDRTLPRRAVALTFDDGYASVGEVAWPLLRERGLPATLYAVSGFLDGTKAFPWDGADAPPLLSAGALRDLAADGMAVGAHSVTHRWLPHLPPEEVRREVTGCKHALEDLLGRAVRSFAYPMGGWTKPVVEAVRGAGYAHAVTVDRGRNAVRQDPLRLYRSFAPRDVTELRGVLAGAYTFLRPLDRWRTRNGPAF
jgi:peptidoglycan/xylan/chitin deacetylase (PgdA/CDA1 family)